MLFICFVSFNGDELQVAVASTAFLAAFRLLFSFLFAAFLRFGRVGSEEQVSEIVGAKVVCVLIGERHGLATAESVSAYIAYNAYVGMPESKRTVVSNIHKDGTAAVEAGAYIAEVIEKILEQKASGVDLVR